MQSKVIYINLQEECKQIHKSLIRYHHETKDKEHQRILARHKIIEDRKEFLERMNTVRVNILFYLNVECYQSLTGK